MIHCGITDGAGNGSQPFRGRNESNIGGGWLPSLTLSLVAELRMQQRYS